MLVTDNSSIGPGTFQLVPLPWLLPPVTRETAKRT